MIKFFTIQRRVALQLDERCVHVLEAHPTENITIKAPAIGRWRPARGVSFVDGILLTEEEKDSIGQACYELFSSEHGDSSAAPSRGEPLKLLAVVTYQPEGVLGFCPNPGHYWEVGNGAVSGPFRTREEAMLEAERCGFRVAPEGEPCD